MLGFGAEVDGQSDPLDDPEEMVGGKSLKAIRMDQILEIQFFPVFPKEQQG
jgi:hypothetical protein